MSRSETAFRVVRGGLIGSDLALLAALVTERMEQKNPLDGEPSLTSDYQIRRGVAFCAILGATIDWAIGRRGRA